jgi:hypothetical protein
MGAALKTTKVLVILQLLTFNFAAWSYEGQEKKFDIRGAYMFTSEGYDLSGDGFTASSANKNGTGGAYGVRWNRPEASYQLEYMSVKHDTTAPSTLAPRNVESEFTRYLLVMKPKKGSSYSSSESGLSADYGIDVRSRRAGRTTPNRYLPSADYFGGRIGASYVANRGKKTYFEAGAGLFIPLYFDERSERTGFRKFSIDPDLKLAAVHNLTDLIALSAGVQVIYEWNQYGGTGHRGTSNAKETFTNIQVPLEIRFQF